MENTVLILKPAVFTCHHTGQLLMLLNKLMLQIVSIRYWSSRALPIMRLTIILQTMCLEWAHDPEANGIPPMTHFIYPTNIG